MLRPRIIPCLLVQNKGLIKTVNFSGAKYIGDPLNAVRIFNEKEVDELIILDISATKNNSEPDFKMIENFAIESQMPLCYGGGIKTVSQAQKVIGLGVEKVALNTAILDNPALITSIAKRIGSQSVVAILDLKRKMFSNKYNVWSNNGLTNTGKCPIELVKSYQNCGVGEIVLNSIDQDGVMSGYDLTLVEKLQEHIQVPMTILGGAGSLNDIRELIEQSGIIGSAAGSLFVFKGKYKAVLINYPEPKEKDKLISLSLMKEA